MHSATPHCKPAYSRSRTESTKKSRKADNGDDSALLRTCRSFAMFITNRALATVWCTFCRPHLPRVVPTWQVLIFWNTNRALVTVWCTFCRQLSRIEARPAETETLLWRPHEPQGFAPERVVTVVTWELMCSRTVTLLYCFHTRTALAHSVVEMTMTWRPNCPRTSVHNLEVFELHFLW